MSEKNTLNPYEHRNTWFANLKRRPKTVASPGYNHSNDWKPTPTHSFMSRALREFSESLPLQGKNLIHSVPYLNVHVNYPNMLPDMCVRFDANVRIAKMHDIAAGDSDLHSSVTFTNGAVLRLTRGSPILTLELPPTVTAMITPLFYDLTLAPPSDYTANRGNDASAACDLIHEGQEPYASDTSSARYGYLVHHFNSAHSIHCTTTAETHTEDDIDDKQCVTNNIRGDPMVQACCNCCPAQCYANVTATATETAVLRLGYYTDAES
eukprot:gene27119-33368_t